MPRENASGLVRDLELVEALAAEPGLGVSELARRTGRDKAQVSRALATLIRADILSRDPVTNGHRPGPRLFAIAAMSGPAALLAAGRAAMRELAVATTESVYLCVLQGDVVLTVHAEVGTSGFRGAGWAGRAVSAAQTSAGRVLVADWTDDEIRRLVRVETSRAATAGALYDDASGFGVGAPDEDAVVRAVRSARADGYATVAAEFEPGLVGASAPVRDAAGSIVAAVNIVGPEARLSPVLPRAGRLVADTAARIGQALGAAPEH